jgi:hypothetical protein
VSVTDDTDRGADAGGGQPAGVAVGQDAVTVGDQRRAVARHRCAECPILDEEPFGLADQPLRPVIGGEGGAQPLHRMHQIDRGWSGGAQPLQRVGNLRARHALFGQPGQQQRAAECDHRRSAHLQCLDHLLQRGHVAAGVPALLLRQQRLVEQEQSLGFEPQAEAGEWLHGARALFSDAG